MTAVRPHMGYNSSVRHGARRNKLYGAVRAYAASLNCRVASLAYNPDRAMSCA